MEPPILNIGQLFNHHWTLKNTALSTWTPSIGTDHFPDMCQQLNYCWRLKVLVHMYRLHLLEPPILNIGQLFNHHWRLKNTELSTWTQTIGTDQFTDMCQQLNHCWRLKVLVHMHRLHLLEPPIVEVH